MFESATLKLTGWYLLIIMVVSLLFSILVYQTSTSEIAARIEQLGQIMPSDSSYKLSHNLQAMRAEQNQEAAFNILVSLGYINLIVLFSGGVASYLMARRTLRPIAEAHEAQSRFVSDASHELRTPLAAMKTELEVSLRSSDLSKSDMKQLLKSNLEEVDKLTLLSATLLKLSKLDYGSLEYEKIDILALTRSAIERYDKTGKRISLKEPAKPLIIQGNQASIEELIGILIDNAMKYSPLLSVIHVTIEKRNNKASFQIMNDGKGITADNLPYIFDRFYQADTLRANGTKSGYGLGLSLAKTIVELHKGDLSVSSAPNKETTFTVLLPSDSIFRRSSA